MSSERMQWTYHDHKRACDYVLYVNVEVVDVSMSWGNTQRKVSSYSNKGITQFFWETQLTIEHDINHISPEQLVVVGEFLGKVSTGEIDMSLEDLNDYLNL